MEAYFDFEELESYYREWYGDLPLDRESFKRQGIWTDPDHPLDHRLHEREVIAAWATAALLIFIVVSFP